ncbi:MAG: ribosome recycling factor [Alphaproteobacteria bacterium]|nr:ribosome recycling factor [Alphaproteobacteria bacterium]
MPAVDLQDIRKRMTGAVKVFEDKLRGIHGGRPSPGLFDGIRVDAYGSSMLLNQVASVNISDARQLSVQVWDVSLTQAVEKAIRDSDLNLNPQAAGGVLQINIPPPSEEQRKQLISLIGKYAEEARVAVRGVRRSGMDNAKAAEKSGGISQDEMHKESAEVQKLTDEFVSKINTILENKEQDLKTI